MNTHIFGNNDVNQIIKILKFKVPRFKLQKKIFNKRLINIKTPMSPNEYWQF